ncbi:protein kinase domain-containing protein [Actinomadura algeriensis]|uniref:DivIVA domain-containing protein n=1 Tax=Actinomadura algeriensis TaxID=1679523 RepID=A0ABR9JVP3_9ACTN|nr:protein kinase [Actinomadura algeriensis]MBE1534625.1 DivIVA domain-containing protein [Actinomadura algeriensis]
MSTTSSPGSRSSDGAWSPPPTPGPPPPSGPPAGPQPSPRPSPHDAGALPAAIGPYRPLELIGAGGMGQVFRATDPRGGTFAVKILHPHLVDQGDSRARLRREVETMGRVTSPRVAEIVEFDVDARVPYIVTRYVEGRSLQEAVREGRVADGAALWRIAVGAAEALEAVHRAGVVHRDIKPGNVLLEGGEPVIIDFGISQGVDDTRLTRTGARAGTWRYLSPELLEGHDAGPAADVFAWAATVAYAATGRDLYDAPNDAAVCLRIIRGDHDLSEVPDELRPLLAEALAADPAARPAAEHLVRRLRALRPDSIGLRASGGSQPSARGPVRSRPLDPIGPYRPLQRLGRGGMGEVFLARADDGRMVAIKMLHAALPAEFQARDRLRREVEAMRRVNSPGVVELVDHDLDADQPYIVTRYVEGTSLLEAVKSRGPLPRDGLLRLAGGLAEALAAVHAAEGVHRDVNPGNVMLVGGSPVLIDFGIAYLSGATRLTQGPMGTPGYVSPEVLEGRPSGPPTDVFGWAATIAFAATGRRAYEATSPAAFVRRVLTGWPDLAGIEPDLREVLEDALNRDPAARPDAQELAARFANPGSIAPRLSRPVPRPEPEPEPRPKQQPPPQPADRVVAGRAAFARSGFALTLSVIEVPLGEAKRELAAAERAHAMGGSWIEHGHAAKYAHRALDAAGRAARDARTGTGVPANGPRLAEIYRAASLYGRHAQAVLQRRPIMPGQLVDVRRVLALLNAARFTRVRFKEGYDPAEVDEFVARALGWLTGDRRALAEVIGADDVRARTFTLRRLRETYVKAEVDAFLAALETELRRTGYA